MVLRKLNILIFNVITLAVFSAYSMEEQPSWYPEYFNEILKIAQSNNIDLYKYLLRFDFPRKEQERQNRIIRSKLLESIRAHNINAVKSLLDQVPNFDINAGKSMSPLATAIYANDIDIAKLLINKGVNINLADYKGTSSALLSVHSPEMLQLLISEGANWNLAINADTGAPLLVQIIEDREIETSKKIEMIKLLASRVDINETYRKYGEDGPDKSALTVAKELRNKEIINVLESFGAK